MSKTENEDILQDAGKIRGKMALKNFKFELEVIHMKKETRTVVYDRKN